MATQGCTLAILGCGKMANAILAALLEYIGTTDSHIKRVLACVKTLESGTRLQKIFSSHGNKVEVIVDNGVRAASLADVVLLGHKPYSLKVVLGQKGMANALEGKLVISILAGIKEAQIYEALAPDRPDKPTYVIRVMPNIAAQIKQSTSVISEPDSNIPTAMVDSTKWMFERVGKVSIAPESMFGLATVLTGACIALTTIAVEGILDAAVVEGMPRAKALELVSQCLLGTFCCCRKECIHQCFANQYRLLVVAQSRQSLNWKDQMFDLHSRTLCSKGLITRRVWAKPRIENYRLS